MPSGLSIFLPPAKGSPPSAVWQAIQSAVRMAYSPLAAVMSDLGTSKALAGVRCSGTQIIAAITTPASSINASTIRIKVFIAILLRPDCAAGADNQYVWHVPPNKPAHPVAQ